MSTHEFTLKVVVDDDALAVNNRFGKAGTGVELDTDPSEWGDNDLVYAISNEIASVEIVDYRTGEYAFGREAKP